MQDLSTRDDVPDKGPLWISKSTIPVFSDRALRDVFLQAINHFGEGAFKPSLCDTDSLEVE